MSYENPYVDKELNRRLGINEDAMHITQAELAETMRLNQAKKTELERIFYGKTYDEYETDYARQMLPLSKKLGSFMRERFANKNVIKGSTNKRKSISLQKSAEMQLENLLDAGFKPEIAEQYREFVANTEQEIAEMNAKVKVSDLTKTMTL